VKAVRRLERSLESLLEGLSGRVFSGRRHPTEIAARLAREADLARFDGETGPATANVYAIAVNPRDLPVKPPGLERALERDVGAYAAEEGLRLEGPVRVELTSSPQVPVGGLVCTVAVESGPPVTWARLKSEGGTFEIGRNRALLGRSPSADVVVANDLVSRRHALIWRQGGQAWVRDLGSSNGTTLDGAPVGPGGAALPSGSVVAFAGAPYRFVEL